MSTQREIETVTWVEKDGARAEVRGGVLHLTVNGSTISHVILPPVKEDSDGFMVPTERDTAEAPETPRIWRDIKRSWSLANGELLVLECGHSAHVGPYPTGRCEQSGIGLCRAWCDRCTAKNEIETLRSRVRSLEIERRRESPPHGALDALQIITQDRDEWKRRCEREAAKAERCKFDFAEATTTVQAENAALRKVAEAARAVRAAANDLENYRPDKLRDASLAMYEALDSLSSPSSCDPKVKP